VRHAKLKSLEQEPSSSEDGSPYTINVDEILQFISAFEGSNIEAIKLIDSSCKRSIKQLVQDIRRLQDSKIQAVDLSDFKLDSDELIQLVGAFQGSNVSVIHLSVTESNIQNLNDLVKVFLSLPSQIEKIVLNNKYIFFPKFFIKNSKEQTDVENLIYEKLLLAITGENEYSNHEHQKASAYLAAQKPQKSTSKSFLDCQILFDVINRDFANNILPPWFEVVGYFPEKNLDELYNELLSYRAWQEEELPSSFNWFKDAEADWLKKQLVITNKAHHKLTRQHIIKCLVTIAERVQKGDLKHFSLLENDKEGTVLCSASIRIYELFRTLINFINQASSSPWNAENLSLLADHLRKIYPDYQVKNYQANFHDEEDAILNLLSRKEKSDFLALNTEFVDSSSPSTSHSSAASNNKSQGNKNLEIDIRDLTKLNPKELHSYIESLQPSSEEFFKFLDGLNFFDGSKIMELLEQNHIVKNIFRKNSDRGLELMLKALTASVAKKEIDPETLVNFLKSYALKELVRCGAIARYKFFKLLQTSFKNANSNEYIIDFLSMMFEEHPAIYFYDKNIMVHTAIRARLRGEILRSTVLHIECLRTMLLVFFNEIQQCPENLDRIKPLLNYIPLELGVSLKRNQRVTKEQAELLASLISNFLHFDSDEKSKYSDNLLKTIFGDPGISTKYKLSLLKKCEEKHPIIGKYYRGKFDSANRMKNSFTRFFGMSRSVDQSDAQSQSDLTRSLSLP